MRAAAVIGLLALAACTRTRECKPGTLLVSLHLDAATAQADRLVVTVTVGTTVGGDHPIDHHPGTADGTIEIYFPQAGGYPAGTAVSVSITATLAGAPIGSTSDSLTLAAGCSTLRLAIGPASDGGRDLSQGELGGVLDLAIPDGSDLAASADLSDGAVADAFASGDGAGPDQTDLTPVLDLGPPFTPSHVNISFYMPAAANLTGVTSINTSTLQINGAAPAAGIAFSADANGFAVLSVHDWTVANATTVAVSGSRPLVVVASGDVSIAGTINAAANKNTAGPGGSLSDAGLGHGPAGSGSGSGGTGGDGASFAGLGGKGGSGNGFSAANPTAIYGDALASLQGGSGGGSGGGGGASPALGGAGGGAIQISSTSSIVITASGVINAGGGGGAGGVGGGKVGGGGGGGSGGQIFLEAEVLSMGGILAANGGGGGGGSDGSGTAQDGANGGLSSLAAGGGMGLGMNSGDGGGGGSGNTAGGVVGVNGSKSGGGGGGAAGRIGLRSHGAATLGGGNVISPTAVTDTSL